MSDKPAASDKPKGSKSKIMIIVAGVLLLAGAGGGYFWYSKQAAAAAAEAEEEDDEEEHDEEDEDEAEEEHDADAGHDREHADPTAGEHDGERVAASHSDEDEDAPRKKKKKKKRKKSHDEGAHARLMSFEPFVVNLADPGAARFLRTNVQLVVSGGADEGGGGGHGGGAKGPSVEDMRTRSAILELLSAQTSDRLTTPAGKEALKERIMRRVEAVLEESGIEVEDVLFSDFVIQF